VKKVIASLVLVVAFALTTAGCKKAEEPKPAPAPAEAPAAPAAPAEAPAAPAAPAGK